MVGLKISIGLKLKIWTNLTQNLGMVKRLAHQTLGFKLTQFFFNG